MHSWILSLNLEIYCQSYHTEYMYLKMLFIFFTGVN